jgi:hypothetical protein
MYLVERVEATAVGEPPASTLALSNRVREGELFAFVEIGAGALGASPGNGGGAGKVAYHSNSPTFTDLHQWLTGVLNQEIRLIRLREAGLDPAVVDKATVPIVIQQMGLASAADDGDSETSPKRNE